MDSNLLEMQIKSVGSEVVFIEESLQRIYNLLNRLILSERDNVDVSMTTMLKILQEETDVLLSNEIVNIHKCIDRCEKCLMDEHNKPKRTSQRKTTASRKPRVKKTPDVVDMVDTILDKEKQVVNS